LTNARSFLAIAGAQRGDELYEQAKRKNVRRRSTTAELERAVDHT
jgi:hypothetical protein